MTRQKEIITLSTSLRSLYTWGASLALGGLCLNLMFHFMARRLNCLYGCSTTWTLLEVAHLMGTCLLYLGLILLVANTVRLFTRRSKQGNVIEKETIETAVSIKTLYLWSIGMVALDISTFFFVTYLYANPRCRGDNCIDYEPLVFLCQFVIKTSVVIALTLFIIATALAIRHIHQRHAR